MSNEALKKTRDALNQISCSFCLAKWLQVTIHLHNGQTHSCHHPGTHSIPLEELKEDPSALHNTSYKMAQRKLMLEGQRPDECNYCWNIEDLPGDHISDRVVKSNDPWAKPSLHQIAKLPWNAKVNPTYVEVSFSNLCNFKCSYCLPMVSSKWMAEILEHGPYQVGNGYHNTISHLAEKKAIPLKEEANPYIEAFWQWWPSLKKDLKVFRITGGEPLLSRNTFKVLESLIEDPEPRLELAVNTNLGVPESIVQKFVAKTNELTRQKAVKKLWIYTSLDTVGPQAEYIRHGLELELFNRNLSFILENMKETHVTFMCTFNILSIPKFDQFLHYVQSWKEKARQNNNRVVLDISYLQNPKFLSVRIGDASHVEKLKSHLSTMKSLARATNRDGFDAYEVLKLERLVDFMEKNLFEGENQIELRNKFQAFIREHDRRRGTDFLAAFPEYEEFLNRCVAPSSA